MQLRELSYSQRTCAGGKRDPTRNEDVFTSQSTVHIYIVNPNYFEYDTAGHVSRPMMTGRYGLVQACSSTLDIWHGK